MTTRCCGCSKLQPSKYLSYRVKKSRRGSESPAFLPWRPRSRTRFLPRPASVSGGCQFEPVTLSRREGPPRELLQQISRSCDCALYTGCLPDAHGKLFDCKQQRATKAGCECVASGVPGGLQSADLPALPKLSSGGRCSAARRR